MGVSPALRQAQDRLIGTSPPPVIDNVVDSGIRMPDANETPSERKKREDADEEERKRKLKLKVSQLN